MKIRIHTKMFETYSLRNLILITSADYSGLRNQANPPVLTTDIQLIRLISGISSPIFMRVFQYSHSDSRLQLQLLIVARRSARTQRFIKRTTTTTSWQAKQPVFFSFKSTITHSILFACTPFPPFRNNNQVFLFNDHTVTVIAAATELFVCLLCKLPCHT